MKNNIFQRFGIEKVINASSWVTVLGGNIMPQEVVNAMAEVAPIFLDMVKLNDKAGDLIAKITGAEAGLVVNGASAGQVLMVAACMTGNDEAKAAQLPNTKGMKTEIIIQRCHRNRYDGAFLLPGAKFNEIGKSSNTSEWEFENAINENTLCISYIYAPFHKHPINLSRVIELAHKYNIPVIVDAAAEIPPSGNLKKFISEGADMVTFSGGKGIKGPQSSGILCGKKDLIDAAKLNSLNYHSHHANIGRPMKVCKEEIIGLMVALELFEKTDHEKQWKYWKEQSMKILNSIKNIEGLQVCLEEYDHNRQGPQVVIYFNHNWRGPSQRVIRMKLLEGNPPIHIGYGGYKDEIWVTPVTLQPGEEDAIADRLRKALLSNNSK